MNNKDTLDSVLTDLQAFVDKFETKQEAAEALGVSRVFLWRVLNRVRMPTDTILSKLGYRKEREITYTYIKEDA